MSRLLFDFLSDSFLFVHSPNLWADYTDAQIDLELSKYKEYAKTVFPSIVSELQSRKGIFSFAGLQMPDISLLRQLALYLDAIYIYDPVFSFRDARDSYSRAASSLLGYRTDSIVDRERLRKSIEYMKSLTPLVAAEYAVFLPFDLSPDFTDGVPIYMSENYFDDLLPDKLREWFSQRAVVRTLVRIQDGWRESTDLVPCRGITVGFSGDDESRLRVYHLFENRVVDFDDKNRTVSFEMTFPSEPPDLAYFNAWVHQSVNRAAHDIYRTVFHENLVSSRLSRAIYLTSSKLVHDLLQVSFAPKIGLPEEAASCLLRMDLPVLQDLPLDDLMRIRSQESPAFQTFRSFLERRVSEIRKETDPVIIGKSLSDLEYEIRETNIRDISTTLSKVKSLLKVDAILLTGTLITAILAGGWGIIPSAISAIQGFRTYDEYRKGVKQNPSYLYWKMQKANKTSTADS